MAYNVFVHLVSNGALLNGFATVYYPSVLASQQETGTRWLHLLRSASSASLLDVGPSNKFFWRFAWCLRGFMVAACRALPHLMERQLLFRIFMYLDRCLHVVEVRHLL